MIITGKARQNGAQLGRYLVENQKEVNERVRIFEVWGTTSQDPKKAILEMSLAAELTKGKLGLYHATINPDKEKDSVMTDAEYKESVDILERELGFEGQSRVCVIHEKIGKDGYLRQHMHVVWQREKNGKFIASSKNYEKHDAAREKIEIALTHARTHQVGRTKEDLTKAYHQAKSGEEFIRIVNSMGYRIGNGYTTGKGNTKDFCVIDQNGHKNDLIRQLKGVSIYDLRDKMKTIKSSLPDENTLEGHQPMRNAENQKTRREEGSKQKEILQKAKIAGQNFADILKVKPVEKEEIYKRKFETFMDNDDITERKNENFDKDIIQQLEEIKHREALIREQNRKKSIGRHI